MRIDNEKGRKIIAFLEKNPGTHPTLIARAVGCSRSYAFKVVNELKKYGDRVWCVHGVDMLGEPCPICIVEAEAGAKAEVETDEPTPEELDTVLEAAATMAPAEGIDKVLDERGSRYGSFLKHAIITQRLKAVMSDTPNWIALNDDMVESLEMIAHKIGRILNGDPSYADSWVDIAGYAKLVADRLEGKER